jgi:cobalt/nickel transport system permease protein
VHLADGIVTAPAVLVGLDLVGAGAVAVAARHADSEDGRAVAWTGMLAAFLLAAQAVNVPLLPGTSAHVIGAALVTLAVGPARAIVAMTAVLLVQALAFGDGGITVLGINVLNLAVLPSLSVELVARVVGRSGRALTATAVLGTLVGNLAGASALAMVLVAGAGAAGRIAFPWLVGAHALAGLAEGILTAVAVAQLERRAPGLVSARQGGASLVLGAPKTFRAAIAWTAIAVGLATALVPLRSTAPDALERLLPGLGARP